LLTGERFEIADSIRTLFENYALHRSEEVCICLIAIS
jgi:hypothetical protein